MPTEPPRTPLTRERVLDAAIALADREGVDALSMRRLGAELGVQAMSLYNHVASKQDLLDGVAGRLLAGMEIPAPAEAGWEVGLRQVCRSYRRLAHDHPGLFPTVLARPLASPEVLPPLEATLAFLRKAGLDAEAALDVFQACASFVGGFALGEINRREDPRSSPSMRRNERDEWPATHLLDDRYPVTAEVLRQAAPDLDRAFEVGLDLLIGGLPSIGIDRRNG
ncbi:MAG TPA: TetR/AcrR family transcriptional regulator C-terminal domain-containing protein [Thermomicrobiales bacterium]|nr:TetR/AcrR family transcriptional regulator C-terminal domain-containing protein [Thermomicrobiales bacterium]